MKKKIILSVLIVLLCSLGVIACGDSVDTTSPAKIVITVESSVPTEGLTVVASRGEFKRNGNVFTLDLDNRNLTTVSVSAKNYRTFTTEVKASDYVDGVYSKTVNYDEKLGTSIGLTVKNMTEDAEIVCDNDGFTVNKTGKNKFELYISERGAAAECNVTLSAEGYEPRVYSFTQEVLASGYYTASTRLIKTGFKMIEVMDGQGSSSVIGRDFDIYSPSYDSKTRVATYVVKDNDVVVLERKGSGNSASSCIYTKDLPVYGTTFNYNESSTNKDKYVILDKQFENFSKRMFLLNNDTWESVEVWFENQWGDKDKVTLVGHFPKAGQYTIVTNEYDETGDNHYYFARGLTIREEDFNNLSYTLSFPTDRRKLNYTINDYVDYETQQPIVFPEDVTNRDQWLGDNGYYYHSDAYKLDGDNYTTNMQYAKKRSLTLKFDMTKSVIDNLNKLDYEGSSVIATTDTTLTVDSFSEYGEGDESYIGVSLSYLADVNDRRTELARETYYIKLNDPKLNINGYDYVYGEPLVFHGFKEVGIGAEQMSKTNVINALDDMPSEIKPVLQNNNDGKGYIYLETITFEAADPSMIKTAGRQHYIRYDAKFTIIVSGRYYADTYDKNYNGDFEVKSTSKHTYTEVMNTYVEGVDGYNGYYGYYDIQFTKISHKFNSWDINPDK